MTNDFSQLDAQDEMYRLAFVSSVEVETQEHTIAKQVTHSTGKLGQFAEPIRLIANLAAEAFKSTQSEGNDCGSMASFYRGRYLAYRLSAKHCAWYMANYIK